MTGSIDSDLTVRLIAPQDVLGLGREIVNQLELENRGAVLERWLSHHLAEVIDEAEHATGTEKAAAEERAVSLILKLWAHRRALPEVADPLGGLRKAIAVLGRFKPEANPWSFYRRTGTSEDELHEMFECMTRIMIGGIALTYASRLRSTSSVSEKALEKEEKALLKAFNEWEPFLPPSLPQPKVKVVWVDPEKGESEADAAEQDDDAQASGSASDESNDEHRFSSAISGHLKQMQKLLGNLLSRWEAEHVSTPQRGKSKD